MKSVGKSDAGGKEKEKLMLKMCGGEVQYAHSQMRVEVYCRGMIRRGVSFGTRHVKVKLRFPKKDYDWAECNS